MAYLGWDRTSEAFQHRRIIFRPVSGALCYPNPPPGGGRVAATWPGGVML